ncbi:hypothetical protein ABMA27_015649 [Loxostege sticticalis]|uniref:Retinol dehydrogenase 11 n=1 Tax=Loxostege sticticalis TaxID=481309 RepID=A0ABR3I8I1_LOXSC
MDIILILLVIVLCMCVIGLHFKSTNKICKSKIRLDGKTCLVTGGTSGVGLEIALDFAMRGARVIVACPFEDEGIEAREKIVQESGNDNVEFKLLDLGSFKSVRDFAADFIKAEDRLDILMNNAGVGIPDSLTTDGLHIIMQVNYLGAFLLTILLLPLLKKTGTPSAPSRIVNTTSVLHRIAMLDLNDLNMDVGCNLIKRLIYYGDSKLSLMLFSRELTKRLKGANVVINNADPGEVGTRIFYSSGVILGFVLSLVLFFLSKTPFEGAQTPIHAAVDEKTRKCSAKYFRNCTIQSPSNGSSDIESAKKLWEQSVAVVNLSKEDLDKCLKEN